MCLIVVKNSRDGNFSIDNFDKSFSRNSDGMGIMWLEGNRVKVERMLGPLKQQRKVYLRHMHKDLFVLHQRYATHGSKELMMENCHPYKIMDMDDGDPYDIYMAHNGVIGETETSDADMSDTWNFIENHIKPIIKADPFLLWSTGIQRMISKYVGTYNKLVFLSNIKHKECSALLIFNEPQGAKVNGCWLSNTNSINSGGSTHNSYQKWWGNTDTYEDAYGCGGTRGVYQAERDTEFMDNKWHYDNHVFDDWDELEAHRLAKAAKDKQDNKVTVLDRKQLPALVDHRGEELKKKPSTLGEDYDKLKYKEDLRYCVLEGEYTIEDVRTEFDDKELQLLQDELMEMQDDEEQALCAGIRAVYDPDNVDHNQMEILIDKISKDFKYEDLEVLVDREPQIAADMLEFLLFAYVSENVKAA